MEIRGESMLGSWQLAPLLFNNYTMKAKEKSRVLIFFSNPKDTPRMGLSYEWKSIQQLAGEEHEVKSIPATTVQNVIQEVGSKDYHLIQFSGHGSKEGFYLENISLSKSQLVTANELAKILVPRIQSLRAALFISCYSTDSIPALIQIAPYIITISGAAHDQMSIKFVETFYESYFKHNSISRTFYDAQQLVDVLFGDGKLIALLSRRGWEKHKERKLIEVFPNQSEFNSIIVDITDVEEQIKSFEQSEEEFLSILTRKIRLHKWIFKKPREEALIPIGEYFGVFTWDNPDDVVICNKILSLKDDIKDELFDLWADLIVTYNNIYLGKHRDIDSLNIPRLDKLLAETTDEYRDIYTDFFLDAKNADLLKGIIRKQFSTSRSYIKANLKQSSKAIAEEKFARAMEALDNILSSLHDLMNALTKQLTE